jgi:hypothetical protein
VELTAYRIHGGFGIDVIAAPRQRAWMEWTPDRFANRCLPLLIANQHGWLLMNPTTVRLSWTGEVSVDSVSIHCDQPTPQLMPLSHFGSGIVTWNLPYLFRTSPGWNLLVRGPANCPKDGIYALEGVVETDWATAPFTMNWQLTRPGHDVVFAEGEPLAMITPQRRGDVERVVPMIRDLAEDEDLASSTRAWMSSRETFNAMAPAERREPGWERDYFQGRTADQRRAPEHQTRLNVREFSAAEPAGQPEGATAQPSSSSSSPAASTGEE